MSKSSASLGVDPAVDLRWPMRGGKNFFACKLRSRHSERNAATRSFLDEVDGIQNSNRVLKNESVFRESESWNSVLPFLFKGYFLRKF